MEIRTVPLYVRILLTAVAVVFLVTASQAPPRFEVSSYVALGDSSAAGPLIPRQLEMGCMRSSHNYAHYAAQLLDMDTLTDASCTSATTQHMYTPQSTRFGDVPPQLDALTPGTDLVTIHIGANDISLLNLATSCFNWKPDGDPCYDDYTNADGTDYLLGDIEALRPRITRLIDEVAKRSPHAEIFLVGYATYLPDGGCYPKVPVYRDDADYISETLTHLNALLSEAAAAKGAGFIDLATASIGHDVCQSRDERWVEPYIPGVMAAPFHPNRRGMYEFAKLVAKTVSVR